MDHLITFFIQNPKILVGIFSVLVVLVIFILGLKILISRRVFLKAYGFQIYMEDSKK